jgi:hypothetical protein
MNDHYTTLGVRRNASVEEIKKAYLRLVRNYHPDKLPPGIPELVRLDAAEKFLVIQNAYDVLSSSERFLYDTSLGIAAEVPRPRAPSTPPPAPPPQVLYCRKCGSPLTDAGCARCIKQQSSVVYHVGRGVGSLRSLWRKHPILTLILLVCLVLVGIDIFAPRSIDSRAAGQFAGKVVNTTVNQSAQVELAIRQSQENLTGCLLVRRPLFGSGQVTGSVHGNAVEFVANSSLFDIKFNGQKDGDKMSGTYIVTRGGIGIQHGTFTLSRTSTPLPDGLTSSDCRND